ncbi:MAG: hypothetical protein NC433_13200 [Clostridiales bacterium]|nr:hypothetical protein [Clostridiales bacterium]
MKNKLSKIGITFLTCFLFTFMLCIFGPSEIFFANVTGFQFVYGDFGGYMAVLALAAAIILTAIIAFLPDKIHGLLLSLVFGISLAGYIQVMFLNKNLDLLGMNPEGYKTQTGGAIFNAIIWLVIIAAVVVFSFIKFDMWKKLVAGLSAFLLCIQLVALISLLVSADENAYRHPTEDVYFFSGEEQYTVSADKNVIVLVLDYFSNQYLAPLEQAYPGATDFLHDFTYYSNMDCTYYGTYPSLVHMITGREIEPSKPINEWFVDIWQDEKTKDFYSALAQNDYKFNLYTAEAAYICGMNDVKMLDGMVSNVINVKQDMDVNYKLLFKTMVKMSSYRMFPEFLKPLFYTNMSEYEDIVIIKKNRTYHNNYEFYDGLKEKGLQADKNSNYVIIQHLMGTHEYTTGENCEAKDDSTLEETAKGCMVLVEEYLNQLKELGVYDNSTIIITADHGGERDSQVIFYIKEPGESHEVMPVTNAPASFNEFMPTIAKAAGLDSSAYGQTIYDFSSDELRERTVWIKKSDFANYPVVQCYTGLKEGDLNVYYGYTYTGDIDDLFNQIDIGPNVIVPMTDSFW